MGRFRPKVIFTLASSLFTAHAATAQMLESRVKEGPHQKFEALTGKLVPMRCYMGDCGWLSIEAAVPVGESTFGQLFAVASRFWTSHHPNGYEHSAPKTGGDVSISYVYCSRTIPMLIKYTPSKTNKRWEAEGLAIGVKDGVFGAVENAHIFYFAACHKTAVPNVYDLKLPKTLGYDVKPFKDGSETTLEISTPEEVLR